MYGDGQTQLNGNLYLKKLTFWHKSSGSDWSIFKGMNTILFNGRHLKKADTLVNKGQMQNISQHWNRLSIPISWKQNYRARWRRCWDVGSLLLASAIFTNWRMWISEKVKSNIFVMVVAHNLCLHKKRLSYSMLLLRYQKKVYRGLLRKWPITPSSAKSEIAVYPNICVMIKSKCVPPYFMFVS